MVKEVLVYAVGCVGRVDVKAVSDDTAEVASIESIGLGGGGAWYVWAGVSKPLRRMCSNNTVAG